jgi:FAD/FMN-containing dehydrogenase
LTAARIPGAALAALKEVLGPGGWLEAEADLAPYLVDFRRLYRGATPLVARPKSVAEVAAVVAICARERIGIVPHGGNTSYCGGATPDASGAELVLSLARLNRVRAVDPVGYALTVDAGCTLAAARDAATAAGRLFPLALGSQGSCQIGGNLSTNAGGTAVLRYGMMRELVLGLEVVLPDGRVLDQLRSLRKDNTGYDVKQLFLGAEGTLGVITGACLKLFARPADYVTALAAIGGIADAVALLGRVRDAFGDAVEGFEFLPRIAYELSVEHLPGTVTPFDQPHPAFALVELAAPGPWPPKSRRAASATPWSPRRASSAPHSGRCASTCRTPRPAPAPRSSTTCRCQWRGSPSSSRRPARASRCSRPGRASSATATSATATCTST